MRSEISDSRVLSAISIRGATWLARIMAALLAGVVLPAVAQNPQGAATTPATTPAVEADNPASGNNLTRSAYDIHTLILDEDRSIFLQGELSTTVVQDTPVGVRLPELAASANDGWRQGVYTSRSIAPPFPFNDVVPSYNVDLPDATGFAVQLRVGRLAEHLWSPWFYLGRWGRTPEPPVEKVITHDLARVDVDYLRSEQLFDRLQYRLTLFTSSDAPAGASPLLRRFALAVSNTHGDADLHRRFATPIDPGPAGGWTRRLPVPYRSQKSEDPKIAGSICSPTSVGMVMAYRGVEQPTARMAELIYDAEYEIYGNWARAVQGAYAFGVPGYLERFGDWNAVRRYIARGQPVIASIKVPKSKQLRGAPYRTSDGHLLVITGFDDAGHVLVNDPAAKPPAPGELAYPIEDLESVWFGHGGVGYILEPLPDNAPKG